MSDSVHVLAVRPDGVERYDAGAIKALLAEPYTIVWVDVVTFDADASGLLSEVFGFHTLALHDCAHRNTVPKCHVYPDAVEIVLQAPEPGEGGHVHHVELDQLVGRGLGHRPWPPQPRRRSKGRAGRDRGGGSAAGSRTPVSR
jgi:magnesium transporter